MDKRDWDFCEDAEDFAGEPRRRRGRHSGGPFGGAGPFAGAGPFGGAPGGPPWGGGGNPWPWLGMLVGGLLGRNRRARRGDVRAGILVLLSEQPRNGYQIMQELEQRSQGWRPSSGSIYPALAQLEDEGLVQEEKSGSGRTFHLTERGKSYVAKNKDDLAAAWESATGSNDGESVGEERWELVGMIRPVAHAFIQIVQSGTSAQREEARRVLGEARRALYRILAEEDDEA